MHFRLICAESVLIAGLLISVAATSDSQSAHQSTQLAEYGMRLSSSPLAFTKNLGQWPDSILFRADGNGATMWLTATGAYYQLFKRIPGDAKSPMGYVRQDNALNQIGRCSPERDSIETILIKASFIGANPTPNVEGDNEISYKCNFFLGNDSCTWRTDVPNYTSTVYRNLYSGIDLKYYGNGRQMEYDFVVAPGADYSQIRIRYDGAISMSVGGSGELVIETEYGSIIERSPVVYQIEDGKRRELAAEYTLCGGNSFGFSLSSEYNADFAVIIDPVLVYSTYLGGSSFEWGTGLAIDQSRNAYMAGRTSSADFPKLNPYDNSLGGGNDVFVTKLAPGGRDLVYSTYLGGTNSEYDAAIAADQGGSAFLTGYTYSTDFPTQNAYDNSYGGNVDAFAVKLGVDGNTLAYSTYLGGSGYDIGRSIAVDALGNAFVTGGTQSTSFPTANAFRATLAGGLDGFLTGFTPDGGSLIFSTYLGGSGEDEARDVALDIYGNVYTTGYTKSSNFPTKNAYDTSLSGSVDAFVTKLPSSGSSPIYSTYLGGSTSDSAMGIVVDEEGSAYVAGFTYSIDFPTLNAYDNLKGVSSDVFVTKITASGSGLAYSTFVGGNGYEIARGIAVDGYRSLYVTGYTQSSDFPTQSAYDDTYGGGGMRDGFVLKLVPAGNDLVYSTYLGGSGDDDAYSVAVDASGNAYISGMTTSSNFPTANAYDNALGGAYDGFVTKLSASAGEPFTVSPTNDTADVYFIRQADLDMDNSIDLVYTGTKADSLYIVYGTTGSSFEKPRAYYKIRNAALTVDYINGDTLLDIVARTSTQVHILLNSGGRNFSLDSLPVTAPPHIDFSDNTSIVPSIASGFFNNDAYKDLVTSPNNVLYGNGFGGFPASSTFPYAFDAVATADFNSDGVDDMVATIGDSAKVFINDGTGVMTQSSAVRIGYHAFDVSNAIAGVDFNKDGMADFAVVTGKTSIGASDTSLVTVASGNGLGGIQSTDSIRILGSAVNLAVNDVNRDKNLDLTIVNARTRTLEIYNGNGLGQFPDSSSAYLGIGNKALLALATADLNRDGNPDYASGGDSTAIIIATNQIPAQPVLSQEMVISGYGGIDFKVKNPLNYTISREVQTVAGSAFWRFDIDHDGTPDGRAFDYNLLNGEYGIVIRPRPGTTPPGTIFSCEIRIDGSDQLHRLFNNYTESWGNLQNTLDARVATDSLVFFFEVEPVSSISPRNGVRTHSQQPGFEWGRLIDPVGVTNYQFQLDKYVDLHAPMYNDSSLTSPRFFVNTSLGLDSVYYWRVRAKRAGSWDAYSRTFAAFIGPGCCAGATGNTDGSGEDVVDISDVFAVVDYLGSSIPLSSCAPENDVNIDGTIDISDLFALIDYLSGAAALPLCP